MYILLASSLLIQSEHVTKKTSQKQYKDSQQTKKKKNFEGRIRAADEQSSLK